MHAAPIGHHVTGVFPFLLEHLVEQVIVLATVDTVDLVVRTHHRGRVADLQRNLEGQQVRFVHRLLADLRAMKVAPRFHVVECEVLHRGKHMFALHAANRFADHGAGQQRIFTRVFEIAPITRVALQIDAAGEQHVEALLPGFAAHGLAAGIRQLPIPARCGRRSRRHRGGIIALADAAGLVTPTPASASCWAGMPRRGIPGT